MDLLLTFQKFKTSLFAPKNPICPLNFGLNYESDMDQSFMWTFYWTWKAFLLESNLCWYSEAKRFCRTVQQIVPIQADLQMGASVHCTACTQVDVQISAVQCSHIFGQLQMRGCAAIQPPLIDLSLHSSRPPWLPRWESWWNQTNITNITCMNDKYYEQ